MVVANVKSVTTSVGVARTLQTFEEGSRNRGVGDKSQSRTLASAKRGSHHSRNGAKRDIEARDPSPVHTVLDAVVTVLVLAVD